MSTKSATSVRLPEALAALADAEAVKQTRTRSEIIRLALVEYLAPPAPAPKKPRKNLKLAKA